MRLIIFHSHFAALGGAEILLATQARWLQAAGHDVRVVAFQIDNQCIAREMAGLQVESIGFPAKALRVESLTAGMMPELIEQARPHLKNCDVVMAFNFPCAPIAAAAANGCRKVWYACEPFRALYMREANPYTVQQALDGDASARTWATAQVARRVRRKRIKQLILPFLTERERMLKQFDCLGVKVLDAVASLSRFGASCVAQATERHDSSVIYPMVRFSDNTPSRRGINRDAPQVLVQTRFALPKNLDTLIRAFGVVLRQYPKAKLHVVGTGSSRDELEGLVREEASGAVTFHGYLSEHELNHISAMCDIFAFAPLDEPFGMVFPEAAARGLLLVGPNHGGPREILEDGAIGALCDPFEVDSVAEGILSTLALSDDAADARRIAANASVRARFGADAIGRQLEVFLRG